MSFCVVCLEQFKIVRRIAVNFSTQGAHRHGMLLVCECENENGIISYFDDFNCTGSCVTEFTLKV